jgi:hypothetical protein
MRSHPGTVHGQDPKLRITGGHAPPARIPRLLPGLALLLGLCAHAAAQDPGSVGAGGEPPAGEEPVISQADFTDPMLFSGRVLTCGDVVTAGTPIAGNATGGGNSGEITIASIPVTATVTDARLYWTVLTNSDQTVETGKTISFDGNVVSGEMVGFAEETPCFTQANTVAWTADVTALVASPGNGTYPVSGFPGDNNLAGANFTEGVSLVITYSDPASAATAVVSYEGLAVTNVIGETLHQTLQGFTAGGTVSATWIPIVGNGQVFGAADELLGFTAGAGTVNLDASLDGGTVAFAAGTCSYLDSVSTQCFWDDDMHDVSAALSPGDLSADVNYESGGDCHSFVAMDLTVSVDDAGICAITGEQVDAVCPSTDMWRNHGEYVSCVAHAAEESLAGLTA